MKANGRLQMNFAGNDVHPLVAPVAAAAVVPFSSIWILAMCTTFPTDKLEDFVSPLKSAAELNI